MSLREFLTIQYLFIFQGFRIRGSYVTFLRFQSLIMFWKLKYENKNNSSSSNGYRLHSSRTTGEHLLFGLMIVVVKTSFKLNKLAGLRYQVSSTLIYCDSRNNFCLWFKRDSCILISVSWLFLYHSSRHPILSTNLILLSHNFKKTLNKL